MRIVVALGGNAILRMGQRGTIEEQLKNLEETARELAELAKDHELVITHGNGPQIGNLLIQQELAKDKVPSMPIDACVAMTQGLLGYLIQTKLDQAIKELGVKKKTTTILTRMIVNPNDPAFKDPTKPIGPFYDSPNGLPSHWTIKKDANRGYRRVVPSPNPIATIDSEAIKKLLESGFIVICAGGGGIPIMPDGRGIEAVIDKDLASYVIAREVGADALMILTDVESAYLNFGEPDQRPIRETSLDEIKTYYEEGHFQEGSMGPKVLACIRFLESGGKLAIIAKLGEARGALNGKTGTIIRR